jgi:mannose/fructose/N-acetylgalactosamine-specific phosphotransferase system component IIC
MRSLGNLGTTLMVLGVGLVALFLFFAALGAFSPTETIVASIVAAVFAVAFAVHMYRVHNALSGHGGTELHRALNMQRERRGF